MYWRPTDQRQTTDDRLLIWKISNGHISTTGYPMHFMFGSVVWFSGTTDQMALFPVWPNPRWRPAPSWKNFKLSSPTAKTAGRMLSNDAFSAKDVPFWKWENLNFIFDWFIRKNRKNTMVLMQTFKQLNCDKSGCTQDRVVIFGSRVWFLGRQI